MKALHVITGLGVGGAEQQLRLLLRHLPVRCDVVTLTNPGAVAEGLRADGVRVRDLGMRSNRDLGAVPRLARLIRRGAYDLVHTHLYRACVYGRIAARLAGTTVVSTEHSLGRAEIEGRPLTRGTRELYLRTERLGAATVAVSDTVAGRLRDWGVPPARIHTVPNGIDAAAFRFDPVRRRATRASLGLPDAAFVVGGVGRMVPGKRFDLLIRAVASLPGARLLLAGDGPEAGSLRALAARLGVSGRVTFLGECGTTDAAPGIPAVLGAVDTFVSASREESFGLAVVEALAAGLPVVHAACPAIEDLPGGGRVPGATRIGRASGAADPTDELTAVLRHRMESGVRRLAPPPAVAHYDIRLSSRRLMDVYAQAVGTAPVPPTERAHP
ncbi:MULTISPECIES: glycosyltransferase [unclassified Streptomyces]|uniref:glycosyltransferase n=1 Tax=unclassified Streptomyces TaxID=2593676 RepID=UPI0004C5B8DA|nr:MULTISPECIES: glycosyltransferase [unclassified Streptomyces]KPC81030.1 glycosyl transferase [Streptomyces sp. NRRL S-4]